MGDRKARTERATCRVRLELVSDVLTRRYVCVDRGPSGFSAHEARQLLCDLHDAMGEKNERSTSSERCEGDYNEDGTPVRLIGSDDREIMDVEADFQGGFNTRLAYKGFDLSAIGAFKSGGILISTLYGSSGYLNLMTGRRGNVKVDYWTPENTGAKYPSPAGPLQGDNPKYGSTLGYFDASYLKIRTISLGYTVSPKLINKAGIEKLRIYCTVQNPFVLFSPYHKESGLDPETNSYGNENAAVAGYQRRLLTIGTNTPSTRNYLVGINLTF